MLILACDPDRGYALARDKMIYEVGTVKGMAELKEKIKRIARLCQDGRQELIVRVERPTNLKTFPRPGVSIAVNMAISRKCGMNYQKATDLGEYCGELGVRWEFVAPARKKLSSKEVKEIFGYSGRTSQHARDALCIAMAKVLI